MFPRYNSAILWLVVLLGLVCVHSLGNYEVYSAKSALIQTAGILAIFGWFLALLWRAEAGSLPAGLLQRPFTGLALLGALVFASWISARFSVDTTRSMETSPILSQSPMAMLSSAGIVLATWASLRQLSDLGRLLSLLLTAGFAVALGGWLQRFGIIPHQLPGGWPGSFTGGPIYLGGMMLMLLPMAVWFLSKNRVHGTMLVLLFLGAFFIAEKRGPFVGLVTAGGSAMVLLGILHNRIGYLRVAAKALGIVFVLLLALAVLRKAEVPIHEVPGLGRLSLIIPIGERTGDKFRSSLWRSVPPLVIGKPALVQPDGQTDPHSALRPLVGYGPDTVEAVLPSRWVFFPPWPRHVIEVSTHSIFWDTALALGLAGVALLFSLIAWVSWSGLRGAGLVREEAPGWKFALMAFAGSVLGGVALAGVYDWGFFGLGAQGGLLAGILAFVFLEWKNRPTAELQADSGQAVSPDSRLLIALLAGFWGHWIDMGFSFHTGNTGLLFWVFCGVIPAAASMEKTDKKLSVRCQFSGVQAGILVGVLLLAIGLAFLNPYFLGENRSIWIGNSAQQVLLLILLFLPVWLWGVAFLSIRPERKKAAAISGGIFLIGMVGAWGFFEDLKNDTLLRGGMDRELVDRLIAWGWALPLLFFAGVLLLILFGKSRGEVVQDAVERTRKLPAWRVGFAGILTALAIVLAGWALVHWPVRMLKSETAAGMARRMEDESGRRLLYEEALRLRPENFRVRILAANASDPPERERLLIEGAEISQFNMIPFALGELLLQKAVQAGSHVDREKWALEAVDWFQRATRYIPQNESAWFLASAVNRELLNNPALADVLEKQADEITRKRSHPHLSVNTPLWGAHYTDLLNSYRGTVLQEPVARRALRYLERAIIEQDEATEGLELGPEAKANWAQSRFWLLVNKGHSLRALGQSEGAIQAYEDAAELPVENRPFDPMGFANAIRGKSEAVAPGLEP